MKKYFFILLTFCIFTVGAFAQIDLNKMSDDELIALQQQIKMTLAAREQQKQNDVMEFPDRIIIPEECLKLDINDRGTGLIIKSTENWKSEWSDKILEVPATIQGFPVTGIGDGWNPVFGYSSKCEGIYIPDGISINSYAFQDFKGKLIRLPNTLETIPYDAFSGSSIETIVIPVSVKEIWGRAFSSCNSLKSIIIPENVKSIGFDAFNGCSNLKDIIIPESVESIGSYAFAKSGIQSLVLPKKLDFGENAFANCDNLETVEIPDDISYTYTIEYDAYYYTADSYMDRFVSPKYLNSCIYGAKIDKNIALKLKLKQIELECVLQPYYGK